MLFSSERDLVRPSEVSSDPLQIAIITDRNARLHAQSESSAYDDTRCGGDQGMR